MRGLNMKDDIIGRVVGYSKFHKMVPVDPKRVGVNDRHRMVDRTQWARVSDEHRNDPELVIVRSIHTGEHSIVARRSIHTVMAKAY